MTEQPAPQLVPTNDPPRIGEIRTLLGVSLRWDGSKWQKVTAHG
ncbi:hypothetical protein GOFOIKOB_5615 [Methylobacterium tardum]|uniref:Uncharacterized protein n=1 Tax=Methylobacterium tardum TaxID=374432 RepID=A0AA37TG26_9HYPH|nr:hypothetical protein [Methylobacterium tardum]GJE52542.1 hypothetical protein GOFOIKOB_5615 [Methylobacterium tardum]GLS68073.1 hypothetical protein GCM10007890_00840 [Methylobacterium tardum]